MLFIISVPSRVIFHCEKKWCIINGPFLKISCFFGGTQIDQSMLSSWMLEVGEQFLKISKAVSKGLRYSSEFSCKSFLST